MIINFLIAGGPLTHELHDRERGVPPDSKKFVIIKQKMCGAICPAHKNTSKKEVSYVWQIVFWLGQLFGLRTLKTYLHVIIG